jgi:hypothetical protein
MEEKEKDELSIKHKLSQLEGLSVHTHWKTTTLPQKCSLTASLCLYEESKVQAGLHVGSAPTRRLHPVMKKTHWPERGNKQAVVEGK